MTIALAPMVRYRGLTAGERTTPTIRPVAAATTGTVDHSSIHVSVTVPATTASLRNKPQSGRGDDSTSARSPRGAASAKGIAVGTGVGLGTGVGVTDGVGAGTAVAGAVGTNVACSTGAAAGVEEGSLPTRNHHASRPIPAAAAAALTTRSNRALLDTVAKATANCVRLVGPLTASERREPAASRRYAAEDDRT